MPVATASASEELEALELARSRLEAALAGDENWRALRQSQTGGNGTADSAAHRARDTRLEMALAGNAHFQAWKHLNGAIDALRSRAVAQAQAAEPLVRPPQGGAATRAAALPDDVEALLRSEAPADTPTAAPSEAQGGPQRTEPCPAPAAAAGGASQSASARLVDRLGQMEQSGDEGMLGGQGRAQAMARQAPPIAADPPEATVTFVVRETRAPVPSSETAVDAIAERGGSAPFERLHSLEDVPAPTAATYLASGVAEEEAEVTIVSVESLKQRRESDARAGIVRRFRKALSGD
jgi:hypothetical protein